MENNIIDRYEKLIQDRKSYEDRAERLSELTIPYLFPKDGSSGSSSYSDTYSGRYAAIAVNSLTSKMVLSLLPPSGTSFKFEPDAIGMDRFTSGNDAVKQEMIKLIGMEQLRINKEIENQQIRPQFFEFMQTMIAVSPVVVEKVKNNGIKWHGLSSFAVMLDDRGEAREIIVKEKVIASDIDVETDSEDGTVYLYTQSKLDGETWTVIQQAGEKIISESTYKLELVPFVYLGWTRQKGDTYHRPYAEQYMGILEDFQNINKVLVEGAIISSKALLFTNPMGTTRKEDVANSKNGDVVDGRADDVTSFQLQKNYDFQVAMQKEAELKKQIDVAFLSPSAARRDAERVTATEVQRDAMELENSLAGIYSTMSKKFNKWLVHQIMKELKISFESFDISVITGLDALGRNAESRKLDSFISRVAELGMVSYVKPSGLLNRYASLDGIDTSDFIYSEKEIQQQKQQAMEEQSQMIAGQAAGQTAGQMVGANAGQKAAQEI